MASRRVSTTRRKFVSSFRQAWRSVIVAYLRLSTCASRVGMSSQGGRLSFVHLRAGGVSPWNIPAQPSHSGTSMCRMSKRYVAASSTAKRRTFTAGAGMS